ncbi:helix-turn-helix domain-containing protein [Terriglobus roseus]|uniref:PTS system, nitrogen regulatory IIA component n=1 Tax=Terriglobus roseus TaxID=392734 RepID=A0A1G7G661_9BACT|nr:helix-turn-helix domain-containing protein [Terriglobus roseus]SDE83634.1 PTS system, nitrogen regulatory IIA component [Terriglobus roseus]
MIGGKKSLKIDPQLGVIASIAIHPHMLSAEELASALSMSPKTIYSQAKNGTLPAIRIGQCVRFDPKHVAEWLSKRVA